EAAARAAVASNEVPTARQAALALSRLGIADGVPVLGAWALDRAATDAERDAAVVALRELGDPRAPETWETPLEDPRLAPVAGRALEAKRDARAVPALERIAATTHYALTRRAAIGALAALGAPSAMRSFAAALGGAEPLPDPFPLAAALGEPGRKVRGG